MLQMKDLLPLYLFVRYVLQQISAISEGRARSNKKKATGKQTDCKILRLCEVLFLIQNVSQTRRTEGCLLNLAGQK